MSAAALRSRGRTEAEEELDFFLELALWLAPRLADPTIEGLSVWLAHNVRDTHSKHILAQLLLLDHPVRKAGEEALIHVLASQLPCRVHVKTISRAAERNVDWPMTILQSAGQFPERFVLSSTATISDTRLKGALLYLAEVWHKQLATFGLPEYQARVNALRKALEPWFGTRYARTFFTARAENRLMRIDAPRCQLIGRALRLLHTRLPTNESEFLGAINEQYRLLRERIGHMVRGEAIPERKQRSLLDNIFEVSTRLSIVRAAERAGFNASIRERKGRAPVFFLARGSLVCEVGKGPPWREDDTPHDDRLISLRTDAGLGSRPSEPDVVLKFFLATGGSPSIFVLGDSKRNTRDTEGNWGYLRDSLDVAVAYQVAYGHLLQATLDPNVPGVKTALTPSFTLFTRYSPAIQVPLQRKSTVQTIAFRDMQLGVGDSVNATFLAWFEDLATQAEKWLMVNLNPT